MQEKNEWDKYHGPKNAGNLFDDANPATTIKGMGFKNGDMARRTIRLSGQRGVCYKQYWCIRAMRERAAKHPSQTSSMRDAIKIFDEWLYNRRFHMTLDNGEVKDDSVEEKRQRKLLVMSHANVHSRSRLAALDYSSWLRIANSDKMKCRSSVLQAMKGNHDEFFALDAHSFVAVFGGPGEHGYGEHCCDDAAARGLPLFRCTCAFTRWHSVTVRDGSSILGPRSHPRFRLRFDGVNRAQLFNDSSADQPNITSFFSSYGNSIEGDNKKRKQTAHANLLSKNRITIQGDKKKRKQTSCLDFISKKKSAFGGETKNRDETSSADFFSMNRSAIEACNKERKHATPADFSSMKKRVIEGNNNKKRYQSSLMDTFIRHSPKKIISAESRGFP